MATLARAAIVRLRLLDGPNGGRLDGWAAPTAFPNAAVAPKAAAVRDAHRIGLKPMHV